MSIQLTVMSLDFDSLIPPTTKKFTKKEITIGRNAENDLVLSTPEVSSHHAKIEVITDKGSPSLRIADLGSTNGTIVENIPLEARGETVLSPNERVRIGNYLIKPIVIDDGLFEDAAPIEEETEISPEEAAEQPETNGFHHEDKFDGASTLVMERPVTETPLAKEPLMNFFSKNVAVREDESSDESYEATFTGKAGDDDINIDFVATALISLSGTVKHQDKPLAGVFVDAASLGTTTTDHNGHFSFDNIPEGTPYSITVKKGGYILAGSTVSGTLSANTALTFSATKLVTIRGRIMHHGKPLAGAEVDAGPLGKTISGNDGQYNFVDVPENTPFTIKVRKTGFTITPQHQS